MWQQYPCGTLSFLRCIGDFIGATNRARTYVQTANIFLCDFPEFLPIFGKIKDKKITVLCQNEFNMFVIFCKEAEKKMNQELRPPGSFCKKRGAEAPRLVLHDSVFKPFLIRVVRLWVFARRLDPPHELL